jgi:hypothetical protein
MQKREESMLMYINEKIWVGWEYMLIDFLKNPNIPFTRW